MDKLNLIERLREQVESHDTFQDIVAELRRNNVIFRIERNSKGEEVILSSPDARDSVIMRESGGKSFRVRPPHYFGEGRQIEFAPVMVAEQSAACTHARPWVAA